MITIAAAAAMKTTMAVGTEGKDNNQLKAAVEEMVAMAPMMATMMVRAMVTGTKIN